MHYTITKNKKCEKSFFKSSFVCVCVCVCVYPTGESHPSFKQHEGE